MNKIELNKLQIKNNYNDNLYLDISIPIYITDKHREDLTIIQFKYLNYMYDELKKYDIYLSLTIVGEKDYLDIYNKYCNFNSDNSYVIFEQNKYNVNYKINFYKNNKFQKMLHDKFTLCFNKSLDKNKNITFLMGSNDFIDINFFKIVKENYNKNMNIYYGLIKGSNYSCVIDYNKKKIDFKNKLFIWDGVYIKEFKNYHYMNGIIGFSNNLLSRNIINTHDKNWHEIFLDTKFLNNNFYYIKSNNLVTLNIKSINDITDTTTTKSYLNIVKNIDNIIEQNFISLINIINEFIE